MRTSLLPLSGALSFSIDKVSIFIRDIADSPSICTRSGGRVYIETIRNIAPGEELFIDYALEVAPEMAGEANKEYACRCRTKRCRGTMLNLI
ncbi:SET domain-containing protein-lysine N-methyltransferase [Paraburkholderia sp. A3BS-1L]|uniref:SET domain-containing protein-lysine N-methyltransferase n=1 Tax=Paraburkholderia sp. A3BS-1L TaxID=3028375 RepID=UPI003DA88230